MGSSEKHRGDRAADRHHVRRIPAHAEVEGPERHPRRRVGGHSSPGGARQPDDPPPRYQPGDDHGVFLAQEPGGHGDRAPRELVARQRRVDREDREQGGHQLGAADDVGNGLDVDRVDGEQEPRGQRRPIAAPTAREGRHGDARTGVPGEVHEVEPPGRSTAERPVEGV